MVAIIRGVELLARLKKTAAIEVASGGTLWQNFHLYTENFQPGEGLVADDELGGERNNLVDPTQMAPGLPTPTGSMRVPLDRNQIGFWLSSLLGAPVTEDEDDPVFEHVWTSGKTAPGLLHLEMPFGANLFRMCDSQAVSQMTIDMADVDGYRQVDLTFIGRSVRKIGAAVAVSPAAAPARDKVGGSKGVIKIDGVAFGNVLGGQMSIGNGAFFERYLDDSEWPSAVEIGQPSASINPQIRMRADAATVLNKFDGVTPFTVEVLYQAGADQLLKFYYPNVVAPKVLPSAAGLGGLDVSPSFMASQTSSAPMLTVTSRNPIEAY